MGELNKAREIIAMELEEHFTMVRVDNGFVVSQELSSTDDYGGVFVFTSLDSAMEFITLKFKQMEEDIE